ncbi:MAG TPA: hypothetical protein PK413_01130 [Thermoanaerobaculia bacterium]|mgnify:CR=1 FL=1|nr:hypothetical protein [Thermoanaerobaculia bacterium]
MLDRTGFRLLRVAAWQRALPLVGLISALPLAASTPREPTLSELVERNAAAMGGKAAVEAVSSIEIDLHLVQVDFEGDALWRLDRTGHARVDLLVDGQRVLTETRDGLRGWQWPLGAAQADEASTDTLRHLGRMALYPNQLFGLHELARRGGRLELKDFEEVGGKRFPVVQCTLPDGYVGLYYLDPASFLITRARELRKFRPERDVAPRWLETSFSDFRAVGGTRRPFAFSLKDVASGVLLQLATVKSVLINPAFDSELFARP